MQLRLAEAFKSLHEHQRGALKRQVNGENAHLHAPMIVMSQLTLMAAACAILMAMPMMMAQMNTLTRDTFTSLVPVACIT